MYVLQILSKRVAHLSGDITESDGLPRRRAFSLSHGSMAGNAAHSVVPRESPLVLKSSSVSSVACKRVEDSVHHADAGQSVIGKLLTLPLVCFLVYFMSSHSNLGLL